MPGKLTELRQALFNQARLAPNSEARQPPEANGLVLLPTSNSERLLGAMPLERLDAHALGNSTGCPQPMSTKKDKP